MSKIKIKLKNPLKKRIGNIYIENLVRQVKPLNIKSILIIGEGSLIAVKLKKEKVGSSIETVKFDSEKLAFKSGSFDLVICVDKLTQENKRVYKEALRISKKYVLVNFKLNPIFLIKQDKYIKMLKVRGVKVVSKKISISRLIVIVKEV